MRTRREAKESAEHEAIFQQGFESGSEPVGLPAFLSEVKKLYFFVIAGQDQLDRNFSAINNVSSTRADGAWHFFCIHKKWQTLRLDGLEKTNKFRRAIVCELPAPPQSVRAFVGI